MKPRIVALTACLLAACNQSGTQSDDSLAVSTEEPSGLEKAAIEAGVIPDVRNVSLSGAFERQSDLGQDRFCAVGNDEAGYQIGLLAVFGPDSKCEGLGAARRLGEDVEIVLDSEQRCGFTASFDGVSLRFPGNLPESCASYCTPRAVLDGVSFYLVGEGDAVARSTRGREIDSLCPSG